MLNVNLLYPFNSVLLIENKEQNSSRSNYHVITGSFKQRSLAYDHINDLRNKGFKKVEILPVSKTGYFRVSAESFSDITLAKKIKNTLIKLKYKDAWILKMALQKSKLDTLTGIKKAIKSINSKKISRGADEVIKRVLAKRQNILGKNEIKNKADKEENKKVESKSDSKTSPEIIIVGDQTNSSQENDISVQPNNPEVKVINENNVVIINESDIQQQTNTLIELETINDLNQDSNQQMGRIISGNLKNDQGRPIPGAEVIVLGTSESIITDFDGNFKIRVSSGQKLEISSIGFSRQTIEINDQEDLDVTLKLKKQENEETDSSLTSRKEEKII